jgi:peroxygenase
MPRANLAVSVESPYGTTRNQWAKKHQDKSTLEQHVLFFDQDNDGVIWPQDTFIGFRQLGYNVFWCIVCVMASLKPCGRQRS